QADRQRATFERAEATSSVCALLLRGGGPARAAYPAPDRMIRSQRAQEIQQVLTLRVVQIERRIGAHADIPEVVDHTRRLSTVRGDRGHEIGPPTVMKKEQPLTEPPQRRCAELPTRRRSLADVVPGADVMYEKIRKQIGRLEP